MRLWTLLLAVGLHVVTAEDHIPPANPVPHVAIIGRGLYAALTAYKLREHLGPEVEIHLITRHKRIDDREGLSPDRLKSLDDHICAPVNSKFGDIMHKLGQQPTRSYYDQFAVFDGRSAVFNTQVDDPSVKYGDDWTALQSVAHLCSDIMNHMTQDSAFCRWNASQLVHSLSLTDHASMSLADLLALHGVTDSHLIHDVIGGLTSDLYYQGTNINAVAGCTAIRLLVNSPQDPYSCFSVPQVMGRLLEGSNTKVSSNTRIFTLRSGLAGQPDAGVVVAANRTLALGPFHAVIVTEIDEVNKLFYVAEDEAMPDFRQWFEAIETYESYVQGVWQTDFFHMAEPEHGFIVIPENVRAGFVSVRRISHAERSIYCIKSETPLQVTTMYAMFGTKSQLFASFKSPAGVPELTPTAVKEALASTPFPIAGHPIFVSTQLKWLSWSADLLTMAADNTVWSLAHIANISSSADACGGNLPPRVVVEPIASRRRRPEEMPLPKGHLAERLKKMAEKFQPSASKNVDTHMHQEL